MRLFALLVALLFAPLAQAAISFVGAKPPASISSNTVSSLGFTAPTGTVAGDLMLVQLSVRGGTGVTFTTPSGWTLLRRDNNGTLLAQAIYYRFTTATEPASYTFTFSPADRAIGAIIAYRGVDTAAPINASGGQANASSTAVIAPSITTTVANARLVGFFGTANGSAGFTPPSGMTERTDVATGAGPNGVTSTTADSTQATAGASGTKTATATVAAANIGQLVAFRPAVVVLTPGRFNAYETTTPAGAIIGVIKTKIAGAAFNLDLIALNAAKDAILTSFTGTVKVELLNAQDNSGTLDANNCRSSWSTIQTLPTNPTFVAADNGRKTVSFQENNAWRELRVRVTSPATGASTAIGCSTDNFAIRPASLNVAVTDANWETAGTTRTLNNISATGGNVHKAGQPFTLTATAVNAQSPAAITSNYNGSPEANLTACLLPAAPTPCTLGTLNSGAWSAASGTVSSTTATYSEAGAFTMKLVDTGFASMDEADSSNAERFIESAAFNAGRFVPNHFDLTTASVPRFKTFNDTTCATRSFTYIGQPFGYVTTPQATITAKNSAGDTTSNYAGALWKLGSAGATQTYTAVTGTLDTGLLGTPGVTASGAGVGSLAANASDVVAFTRTTPVAPFSASISLSMSIVDSAENAVAGNGLINTVTPALFSSMAFDSGNEIRFGQLVLSNAHGAELLDLPVPIETRFWTGSGFSRNTADACTQLAASNVALSNWRRDLNACETSVTLSGRFNAGRGTLKLSKPGAGNTGSVDLTLLLGATGAGSTCVAGGVSAAGAASQSWLQGRWSGAAYDQNPAARGSFGLHRGSKTLIYFREMY